MQKNENKKVKFQNPLEVGMVEIPLKNGKYLTNLRSFSATPVGWGGDDSQYECISVEFSNDPDISVGDKIDSILIGEWNSHSQTGMRCVSKSSSPANQFYSYTFVSVTTHDGAAYSEIHLVLTSYLDVAVGDIYTFRYGIVKEEEVSAK